MLIDPEELSKEPLWKRESVITLGSSVKLAVEVVSTNWPDDYARKFEDYGGMGIQEYWMVDYLGLGGRRYIGSPKQPTMTVCNLVNDLYETTLFQHNPAQESQTICLSGLLTMSKSGAENSTSPWRTVARTSSGVTRVTTEAMMWRLALRCG